MPSFIGTYAVLGVVSSLFGVGALWVSWVNKKKSLPLVIGGWVLILLSIILWAYAGGGDRGTAMGLMALGTVALGFVGYNALKDKGQKKRDNRASEKDFINSKRLAGKTIFKNIGWWFFLFLGCGIASYLAALGIHEVLVLTGTHLSNALLWSLFLFPFVWGGLAIHMLASDSWKNRSLSLIGCSLFGIIMLVGSN